MLKCCYYKKFNKVIIMPRLINNSTITNTQPLEENFPYILWSHCTSHLNYTMPVLEEPKFAKISVPSVAIETRNGPTQHFINNLKNSNDKQYLQEYIDVLPMKEILSKEAELLNTHIPLYTATSKATYLIHSFTKIVMSLAYIDTVTKRLPTDITWFRNPLTRLPKHIPSDSRTYLSLKNDNVLDNTEMAAWNLVSCNPSLFTNTLTDAMESTVDYWWDDNNVSCPRLRDIVTESFRTLDKINQDKISTDITTLIKELEKTIELLEGEHGVLHQIFIPHEEVNSTVYISKTNGIVDKEHTNPIETLLDLQYKSPDSILNYNTMQVRLLAGRFINPNLEADYRTYTYGKFSKEQDENFQEKIRSIIINFLNQHVTVLNKD